MIRTLIIITLVGLFTNAKAVSDSTELAHIANARAEFTKPFDQQNYGIALANLLEALKINENNPESYYLLGYTYDRINAKDASSLLSRNAELTQLASEALEKCISLDKDFKHTLILSPAAKLRSVWQSLALKYYMEANLDSMKWAYSKLEETGFQHDLMTDFMSVYLKQADANSIVFCSGDAISYPLMKLQHLDNIRPDVDVIEVNLLNTTWYTNHIRDRGLFKTDLSQAELDSLDYINWTPRDKKIGEYIWEVYPSFDRQYLLRGDRISMMILEQLEWKRKLYFTPGFNGRSALGLARFSQKDLFGSFFEFPVSNSENAEVDVKKLKAYSKAVKLYKKKTKLKKQGLNPDDLKAVNMLRFYALLKVQAYIDAEDKESGKSLYNAILKYFPSSTFPYQHEASENFSKEIKESLK